MVTDQQVRRLFRHMKREETLKTSADKAGMDEKTARKYMKLNKLPSEISKPHTWRTRKDPFAEVWQEVRARLELNPGLEAKTLFDDLQRRYPGRFADGQLRTLQRRVKHWRATEEPAREVFFAQRYRPGERAQSDFTFMTSLGVTTRGEPFDHLVYHFVLPCLNWETGTICFSESFEALSEGLQNALWELGGVPAMHQTDRLTTAVNKASHPEVFTRRYQALMRHYRLQGLRTQASAPHENGDVEQRHYRFKRAVEQALLLRGRRDFAGRQEYGAFLPKTFDELNSGRGDGRYIKLLKSLSKISVLVLYDWGLARLTPPQQRDLPELLDDHHLRKSTIVTSRLPVEYRHDAMSEFNRTGWSTPIGLAGRDRRNRHKGESMRRDLPP